MVFIKKYNKFSRLLILVLLFSGSIACNLYEKKDKLIQKKPLIIKNISYDFSNPDTIYQLPDYLKEISGISYLGKNKIACVQDEKAIIYIFDIEKGKVISKGEFGKDGDYEGIATVGADAYVLRSDGQLFKIKDFENAKNKVVYLKTGLSKRNNAEGLCFDSLSNSLLIACKDSPSLNKGDFHKTSKAIYKFDLETKKLNEDPVFLIDISKIDSLKLAGSVEKFFIKTAIKLGLTDGASFYPSGIAVHPKEKDKIFVISSIGKKLIVIDRQGEILNNIELDGKLFGQPEGICFSENGDLYISNEGKNGDGNILRFRPVEMNLIKN